MTKEEARLLIKKKVEDAASLKRNILLELATGTGKTFNAINLQSKFGSKITYVCVGERAHIKNWKDEYIKHGFKDLLKVTKIFCYASLKKHLDKIDLLILDEMHHFASEKKLELFRQIKADRVIGLSATVSDEHKMIFQRLFGEYSHVKVTMSQAIKMNLLPKPKFYVIPLELDPIEKTEVILYQRGKEDLRQKITCDYNQFSTYKNNWKKYRDLELTVKCTEVEKYKEIDGRYNMARNVFMMNKTAYNKNSWLRIGSERKRFLSDCKTRHIKSVLYKIGNKRLICFCGSIDQANSICKERAIHSESANSLAIFDSFNNKEIDSIFAIGMLVEGVNLVDIEAAIISQLDGTARTLIQKSGRSFRSKNPEMYIMFFKGTKDEDYLQHVIENVPEEYITILNL